MIGYAVHEVLQFLFSSYNKSFDWKKSRCSALRRPCLRSYIPIYEQYRKPCILIRPGFRYQFIHSTLIKIPFEPVYRLQNTLRKGGLGPGPPKKKNTNKNYIRMVIVWYPSLFVFPDFSRNFNLRCHAGCYSSSSWLKQIAPVGRSNHRVTHGTLVHYDLGIQVPWRKNLKNPSS